jgi:hypothetical protein
LDLQLFESKNFSGKTAYVELDGEELNIYGNGLAALEREESRDAAKISFEFVNFLTIIPYITEINQFENLNHIKFGTSNICNLSEVF